MGEKKKTGEGGHKALYRKYRSKSLDEIVGQEHITKTLGSALKSGRIAHAYLFTGPKGTGKTSIARILAHEINSLPYEDEKTHLDIIEIDAASNRRIDDIRDLRDKVHIAPVSAKYKVYIIDEVHMLTSESFNALLKTLEEPPEHVIFILATTEVHKLPATIVSRTQRHSFRTIPARQVADHLKTIAEQENLEIDDEAALLLAEHGDGSFRDSISLLDQMGSSDEPITTELIELLLGLAPKEVLEKLLSDTRNGKHSEVMEGVEALIESGLTPTAIANQLTKLLRKEVRSGASSSASVQLMQRLLEVSGSQYPQLKLEATLLDVATNAGTPTTKQPDQVQIPQKEVLKEKPQTEIKSVPPVSKPTAVTEAAKKSEVVEESKPETKVIAPANTGTLSLEDWPKVLAATKEKHNPLYTVLRLASPEISGSNVELVFAFPFHQKKIDEPKYKSLLAEVITEQTGAVVVISSVVDKTRVKPIEASPQQAPTDTAHASLISNVQDIMGGGEVVTI